MSSKLILKKNSVIMGRAECSRGSRKKGGMDLMPSS
jgi:hypothetical protein